MKKVDVLLKKIESFVVMSESLLRQAALNMGFGKGLIPEHLLLQAMERATDDAGKSAPHLGKEAYLQLVDFINNINKEKEYFNKIPMNTKWTIEFKKAHLKAIVEKISEAGHPVLILKTFLSPHMYETGSQGLLLDFLRSAKSEKDLGDLRAKIKDARKTLKALERLLTKKFPISVDDIKKSPPEVQKILSGVVTSNKGRPLTEEFVKNYKTTLETQLQSLLSKLPPRLESGTESE